MHLGQHQPGEWAKSHLLFKFVADVFVVAYKIFFGEPPAPPPPPGPSQVGTISIVVFSVQYCMQLRSGFSPDEIMPLTL